MLEGIVNDGWCYPKQGDPDWECKWEKGDGCFNYENEETGETECRSIIHMKYLSGKKAKNFKKAKELYLKEKAKMDKKTGRQTEEDSEEESEGESEEEEEEEPKAKKNKKNKRK